MLELDARIVITVAIINSLPAIRCVVPVTLVVSVAAILLAIARCSSCSTPGRHHVESRSYTYTYIYIYNTDNTTTTTNNNNNNDDNNDNNDDNNNSSYYVARLPRSRCRLSPKTAPRLFPHEARQQSPGEPGAASAAPPVLDSAVLFAWLPGHYLSIRFVLVHGFDPVQFA